MPRALQWLASRAAGFEQRCARRPAGGYLLLALRLVVLSAALYFLGILAAAVVARVAYPYEIEWMEGGVLAHVARILRGQPLYARPTLEFTPFLYPPLYYAVSAAVAKLVGLSLVPLRLVSVVATLGIPKSAP